MARIRPLRRFLLAAAVVAAFVALGSGRLGTRAGATILGGVGPSISINDVSANENVATQTFTVTLSASSANTVTVDYATANGTALAGFDYTATSGTLTFNPGDLTKTIPVSITDDPFDEFTETYSVNLSNATNATILDGQGQGTIADNDPAPGLSVNNIAVTEGTGGTTNAVFTVTLSPRSGKTVTVTATTVDATATQPADYTFTTTNLTFNPGDQTKTVSVPIVTDSLDEPNETFVLHLSNPTLATFDKQDGIGTINDDDPAPSLSVNDVAVTEGDSGTTNAAFTVSLSAASGKTVTVDAATGTGGTATSGVDYTAVTSPAITFAPGELTKTVTVPVIGDALFEANETFFVNLSNASNATLGDAQGQGVIQNDDTAPALSINDVTVTEGDSGTVNASFTVTLTPASGTTATVNFSTVDNTAVAPGDYKDINGTKTFASGETSKNISVQVNGDTTDEIDESFFVHLANPVGATIADADGVAGILNDDTPPSVSLAGNVSVTEGNTGTKNATFTANLSQSSGKTITVDIATADGTAAAPSDYTTGSTTLSFAAGATTKTFGVVVNGDLLVEPDETFTVTLSNPVNATIGTGSATGTITNDDTPPSASINDASVTEGNSGTATATFTVSLSTTAVQTVSVDYATADGTATAPGDYTSTSGTLTFGTGDSSKPVTVLVNGDTTDELDETFVVNLSNASGLTVSDGQGQGTIVDDDGPSISISDVSANEGSMATFTVTLSATTVQPVTVSYATADGTGVAGQDYVTTSSSLTIQPGNTTGSIAVPTLQDFAAEPNETFFVNLTSPSGGTISDAQGQGTIIDDDSVSLSINDASATEGGTVSFTVSLSGTSFQTVTVDYATADGTAVVTQDYTATSGTLTFTPGDLTKTVPVATVQDPFDENDETFTFDLSSPSNATISDSQGQGTILDNDAPGKLSVADTTATEGTGGTSNAVFAVSIQPRSGKVVTVDYTTIDGTATAPGDYTTTTGTLTFNPGDQTKTVSVPIATDSTDEPDETFDLFLSNNVNAGFDDRTGTATVTDDDAPPTISVDDVSVTEGDTGTTNAGFTLSLSAASAKTITINAFTSNGTATAGSDYQAVAITGLTFNPGETTKTVNVPAIGDTTYEANETYSLNLATPVNVTVNDGTGLGTIQNDDAAPTLSVSDVSVTEGDTATTNANFAISLSSASGLSTTVDFFTANGTASSPLDYLSATGTKTFAPGETQKSVTVTVNGDTVDEPDESFFLDLSAPQNAAVGDGEGQATILDDDAAPTISIAGNESVNEGNTGLNSATFTINLSKQSGKTVTATIASSDGSATAPDDYAANIKALTFAPGETSKSFTVSVKGDYLVEPNETFGVALSNVVNATTGTGSATGIIVNDDTGSALSVSDVSATEGGQGSTKAFSFKVTLSPTSTSTVTVNYATTDGTATSGPDPFNLSGQSDYRAKSGTLTFSPGTASKTVSVTVNGDKLGESDETFFVDLSAPVNAVFADPRGVGTIRNDEAATACTILGTGANDVIEGTSGNDIICGAGGADTIHGNDGDDTVKGEDGNDTLYGGNGNDTVIGGNGSDTAYGDEGNDTLEGDGGTNIMYGGDGDDSLKGGGVKDQLYGEAGDDVIHGGDGADTLDGGTGSDQLFGEAANDTLNSVDGVGGNDTVDGGTGTDHATSDPGDTVTHVP